MKISTKRLIHQCSKIAEIAADRNGFVAIRNLASKCNCQVVARPLLVEAAITTNINTPGSWVALINNEIHNFTDEDFEYESSHNPLHVRTRNTLAHEVAHALAIDLCGNDFASTGNLSDRLVSIERAVEKVSPLLLLPKSFLISRFHQIQSCEDSLQAFSSLQSCFGVSRAVLLHATKTLSKCYRSDFIKCESMLGALWGIVEFRGKQSFRTSSIWTFDNYYTTTPHPANRLIQESKSLSWTVESISKNQGRCFCNAVLDDRLAGKISVQFELENIPQGSRTKIFFRLAGKFSQTSGAAITAKTSEWTEAEPPILEPDSKISLA